MEPSQGAIDSALAVPAWMLVMALCGLAATVVALTVASRSRRFAAQGWRLWLAPALSVGIGALYGVLLRTTFSHGEWLVVMTLGFLSGVPFAMGVLSIVLLRPAPRSTWNATEAGAPPPREQPTWATALTLPWASVAIAISVTLLTGHEGVICALMALPLMFASASAGGALGLMLRSLSNQAMGVAAIGSALLPLGAARFEHGIEASLQVRTVANTIDIAAPKEAVWREVARVRAIEPDDLPWRVSHLFGFPRPIEATLSHEGVGAVRKASFERGLVFTETVTTWEPLARLAFTIVADPVPPEALDEHVTIGGPYFDVLDGEYRLEVLAPDRVRLHLSSQHRLSTRFNAYAGWWSDLVMSDIQGAILEVVKARAEAR
jgi:hypothetical protein